MLSSRSKRQFEFLHIIFFQPSKLLFKSLSFRTIGKMLQEWVLPVKQYKQDQAFNWFTLKAARIART
jgi:hypothetical protein